MFQDLYADFFSEQLGNGLSVYVKEWPSASWFYAGVVVHAGAREDPVGRSGLAHLVEHVVGENVRPLTFAQLERLFKTLGGYAWFGTTSYYSSEYKFHLPNEPDKIHQALDLFGQMLLQPKELTQNIEEEKAVILREYHRRYEHEQARSWALQGRPWLFEHHCSLQSYHSAIGVPDGFLGSSLFPLTEKSARPLAKVTRKNQPGGNESVNYNVVIFAKNPKTVNEKPCQIPHGSGTLEAA